MANAGPNTNKSQFFITFAKASHLDRKNAVFGRVIDGLDVLEYMEKVSVNDKYRPDESIKIQRVTIHANPLADDGIHYWPTPFDRKEN